MNNDERQKQIAFHKAELAKLKAMPEEWKPWEPRADEIYYSIQAAGNVSSDFWEDDALASALLLQGNVYETEQLALDESRRRAIHKQLVDCAKGFKPDWNNSEQEKWVVTSEHGVLATRTVNPIVQTLGVTYFETKSDGIDALYEIGVPNMKFLRGIEE